MIRLDAGFIVPMTMPVSVTSGMFIILSFISVVMDRSLRVVVLGGGQARIWAGFGEFLSTSFRSPK